MISKKLQSERGVDTIHTEREGYSELGVKVWRVSPKMDKALNDALGNQIAILAQDGAYTCDSVILFNDPDRGKGNGIFVLTADRKTVIGSFQAETNPQFKLTEVNTGSDKGATLLLIVNGEAMPIADCPYNSYQLGI